MKLYLVHCGFYDPGLCGGVYEFHVNMMVVGTDHEDAKRRSREDPDFVRRRMHIDGLQEVRSVSGHEVYLVPNSNLKNASFIVNVAHRDL